MAFSLWLSDLDTQLLLPLYICVLHVFEALRLTKCPKILMLLTACWRHWIRTLWNY